MCLESVVFVYDVSDMVSHGYVTLVDMFMFLTHFGGYLSCETTYMAESKKSKHNPCGEKL